MANEKSIRTYDAYDERVEITGDNREDLINEALLNSEVGTLKTYLEGEGYAFDRDKTGTVEFTENHETALTFCALPFFGERTVDSLDCANVFYFRNGDGTTVRGRTYYFCPTVVRMTDLWVEDSEVKSGSEEESTTGAYWCVFPGPWVPCGKCPDCLDTCKVCAGGDVGPPSACAPITHDCLL